ncbi:hypothetical protein EXIGLDRAFT_831335 [Exidia glandulosa HHB12029]|uniref:F-box domain-containing protein n=1 Tax=Exidia glandulosa HHB12029 TaxID=1314781 RepID=A0A165MPZ8_EXIGL|nr:hypothetical protein EXIGLDRAFT_831335 [Exidia glandulosa HHB12029]
MRPVGSFKDVYSQLQLLARSYGSRDGSLSLLRRDAVRLNHHAPVNKLPSELLCAIFRSLGQDALRNTPSRVSSRWPIVALGHSSLWTDLVISTRAQVEKAVPVIVQLRLLSHRESSATETIVHRARGTGLRVRFFIPRSTEESRKKDDVRARWPSYVQCANVLAGHVRGLRIGGEVTTPSTHIADFVSCLMEYQGTVQPVSVTFDLDYGLSAASSRQTFKGRPALRRFNTTVSFLPGDWLRNLTRLEIVYPIEVVHLLYIVAYAPNLESLGTVLPLGGSAPVNAQHLPQLPLLAISLSDLRMLLHG